VDLAGFRHGDGFAWGRLETWRERCWRGSYRWKKKAELEEERWVNVTGVLSGEWVRYIGDLDAKDKASGYLDLWKTAIGVGWAFWDPEDRMMNVKGNEGRVMLRVDEKASLEIEVEQEPDTVEQENELGVILKKGIGRGTALVREVAATLTIQDESTSDEGWEMRVYGVHWPRVGALLMTTTSEKFAGIFGLPHLSLRNDYFATSKRLLIAMIENTLGKAVWFGTRNPWTENSGAKADAWRPVPHCEYVVYVQVASAREGVH
jgi:transmembrane E3 ubiquitin-protein ligase